MCGGVSLSAQGISSGSENLRDREEGSIKIMNCHSKMLWVHSRCIGLMVSLISTSAFDRFCRTCMHRY
jgi:hypothetical protein